MGAGASSSRVAAEAADPGGGRYGELVVALDDDAGRTLGLRFEVRDDAPDAARIGFVLALLLRARTRDWRHFEVRTR